jgi:chromosome segregation ATPase
MATDDADALAAIANELYAIAPTEFTAARNARAAELRDTDRALSDAVKQLRRSSPPAWVANLLVRERRDDVSALLALGAEQRAAQSALDRDEIARLTKERRRLVTATAREGAELAREAGHPVAVAVVDQVAETLQAAMADPAAADALLTGRLLRALESVGFDSVDLTDAVAAEGGVAASAARPKSRALHAVDDPDDGRIVKLVQEAEANAERILADADAAREAAEARVAELRARRTELSTEIEDLEEELVQTRRALSSAERESRGLDRERDAAVRAADRARATLDAARERRERLTR